MNQIRHSWEYTQRILLTITKILAHMWSLLHVSQMENKNLKMPINKRMKNESVGYILQKFTQFLRKMKTWN